MYDKLKQLLLEGLSGASRAYLNYGREYKDKAISKRGYVKGMDHKKLNIYSARYDARNTTPNARKVIAKRILRPEGEDVDHLKNLNTDIKYGDRFNKLYRAIPKKIKRKNQRIRQDLENGFPVGKKRGSPERKNHASFIRAIRKDGEYD